MHRALTIAAVAAAAISPLACGDGERAEDAAGSTGAAGQAALPAAETAAGFAARLALTDLYEIAAGRIALERTAAPAVRGFAETMVADHQRTAAELQAEIARQGLGVRVPAEIDARRRDMLVDLREAQGRAFDDRYIDQQIEAHDNALRLLREYAETGDNPALRDWARRTAPRIENHRRMAHALDRADGAGSAETGAAGGQRR